MHFFGGLQNFFFFFRYAKNKKKTCGLKYSSSSKFLHRSTYLSLYTRSNRKNPEKYSQPNCIFSGAKSCKTWRNMQISEFVLKCLFYRNSSTNIFFMTSKGPVLTQILESIPYPNTFMFSGANSGKFWRNMQKRGDFKFKMCLLKFHHRTYSFYYLFMWGSMVYRKKNTHSQNALFRGQNLVKFEENV